MQPRRCGSAFPRGSRPRPYQPMTPGHRVLAPSALIAAAAASDRSSMKFNPPPNWPTPPEGFVPEPGWTPDPTLPAPPPGWQLWVEDDVLLPGETTEAK